MAIVFGSESPASGLPLFATLRRLYSNMGRIFVHLGMSFSRFPN